MLPSKQGQQLIDRLNINNESLYQGKGCDICHYLSIRAYGCF